MSWLNLLRRHREIPCRDWGCAIEEFPLSRDGVVQYAQWRHPLQHRVEITQEEIDGWRKYVSPGDFVVDVGAQCGDTTTPLALAAGRNGCVLAIEANPYVFRVLERNAALNVDRTRIEPRCFAAATADGPLTFHYSDASFCNGGDAGSPLRGWFRRQHPLTVEGRNLAAVLHEEFADWLPRLSFVKIDVEGMDDVILASIESILVERRPTIRAEVFKGLSAQRRRAFYEFLVDCGYQVHRYSPGANPAGQLLDAERMNDWRHFDVLAVARRRASRAA